MTVSQADLHRVPRHPSHSRPTVRTSGSATQDDLFAHVLLWGGPALAFLAALALTFVH